MINIDDCMKDVDSTYPFWLTNLFLFTAQGKIFVFSIKFYSDGISHAWWKRIVYKSQINVDNWISDIMYFFQYVFFHSFYKYWRPFVRQRQPATKWWLLTYLHSEIRWKVYPILIYTCVLQLLSFWSLYLFWSLFRGARGRQSVPRVFLEK